MNLEEIQQRAVVTLAGCMYGPPELISKLLAPTAEDFAAVFIGDAAKQAADAYASFWEKPPGALTKSAGARIQLVAKLAKDIVESREFPGGYDRIAQLLTPDQVWCRFKLIGGGGRDVMAYDGLVARGDRFAWFPKPWRAFKVAATDDN